METDDDDDSDDNDSTEENKNEYWNYYNSDDDNECPKWCSAPSDGYIVEYCCEDGEDYDDDYDKR